MAHKAKLVGPLLPREEPLHPSLQMPHAVYTCQGMIDDVP